MEFERISNLDQVAMVRQSVGTGTDAGWRALDVALHDGLALRILPDRGFDLLNASWRGRALAWISARGEGPPEPDLTGLRWEEVFTGGLLTTCGLANVGEPSEGHGQHGRLNHLPAEDISVERRVQDGAVHLVLRASLHEATADGGQFRLDRTYRLRTGSGALDLHDRVTNLSDRSLPAPFLYHVNLGWPLVQDTTTVEVAGRLSTVAEFGRLDDLPGGWARPGLLRSPGSASVTVEHLLDQDLAEGRVKVTSAGAGLSVTLSWPRAALPRLFQWIDCQPGKSVLAIEPSNACTAGRHVDRARGLLAHLAPGECRDTALRIEVGPA